MSDRASSLLVTRLRRALSSLSYGVRPVTLGLSLVASGTSSFEKRSWGLGLINPTREPVIGSASLEPGRVLAALLASDRVIAYNNNARIRLSTSGSAPTSLTYSSTPREIIISLLVKVGISLNITVSGPSSST